MHYALALTGLLLIAKAIDEAVSDNLHFGWSMTGLAFIVAAGSMY